jgi:hypothetical protein
MGLLSPFRNRLGIFILNAFTYQKAHGTRVLSELHDTEAAFSEVAYLLVLLNGVNAAQRFEYTVEMSRSAALLMGDRRCKIPHGFLTERTKRKVDLRLVRSPIASSPVFGSGDVVLAHSDQSSLWMFWVRSWAILLMARARYFSSLIFFFSSASRLGSVFFAILTTTLPAP